MLKIERPIKVNKRLDIEKSVFINEELKPSAKTQFECSSCGEVNDIEIKAYKTGFPLFNLYRNKLLSEEQIKELDIAKPSSRWSSHFGEYLVYDLPTLYYHIKCSKCAKNFIIVFGLGESQPGKWVCKISGVWDFDYILD